MAESEEAMRDLKFEKHGESLTFSRNVGGGPTLGTVIAEFRVDTHEIGEVTGSVILSRSDVLELIEYLAQVAKEGM